MLQAAGCQAREDQIDTTDLRASQSRLGEGKWLVTVLTDDMM